VRLDIQALDPRTVSQLYQTFFWEKEYLFRDHGEDGFTYGIQKLLHGLLERTDYVGKKEQRTE
jgi:hypothetical protein